MEVVGGRSTAFGSIVEYGVAAGKVLLQPVDQAFGQPARSFVGQCLPLVTFRGDGEVSRQNGVRIQSQAERFVQLNTDRLLLFRLVAQAEEAGTGSDGALSTLAQVETARAGLNCTVMSFAPSESVRVCTCASASWFLRASGHVSSW